MGSWDFSLANYDGVWATMVQIGLLLIFMLVGNILRNVVPVFRKCLIPSALIGGTLLLIVAGICKSFGFQLVDMRTMQVVTYHGLGIGFVAMGLKTENASTKLPRSQAVEYGALQGGTYMLQGWVGLLITIVLFLLTAGGGKVVSYISGVILPLAYGQGPGNALSWDINFTNMPVTQFAGNGSFGLSLASIGFIVASVIGVFYINLFKGKGQLTVRKTRSEAAVITDPTNPDGNEIPDSESVDKTTIQLCFVAVAYALGFGFMCILAAISDFTNSIAWGFNFLWGTFAAMGIKIVLKLLRKKKIINRGYINNYQMDRIAGFAFDLMIVAGVAAIEINDIKNYILPIVILSVIGGITTYVYIRKASKECFKGFEHEMFLTAFGTLTGTASNGMILLKEIDPDLRTPAPSLIILATVPAMVFIAPMLLMLKFAAGSFVNACIACGIFFVLWAAYTVYLFRRRIFKKKYKDVPENVWVEE